MAGLYHIETWGCQMNVHDSDKLAGALEAEGYSPATRPRDADVVLLNSCSVREKAEQKLFSALGRLRPLKRLRPEVVLGVCGCVSQEMGLRLIERAPHVDFILGPRAVGSLPDLVKRLRAGDESARHTADLEYRDDSIRFPFERIRRDETAAGRAYVTIIEGCNHRCSFCIVPTTRGREISRDLDDVLAEVRHLALRGTRQIAFLGQTVNAYRDGSGRTLSDLLVAAAAVEGIERIRFTTSHPAQMSERLMDAMAAARPKVCSYLHLPVQSGSSQVLRAMRRGYDRTRYLRTIEALRARIPDLSLGTDMIVGFPGEGPAEFDESLSLLAGVRFDTVYSFAYSPRPGTPASKIRDSILPDEKLERLRGLQALQRTIQEERNRRWVGREVEVLVEGAAQRDATAWCGRTSENRVVNFRGRSGPGRIEKVRITGSTAYSLRGELVAGPA